MKTISRYIMTLALLITAVGGAWAVSVGAKIGTTAYATLGDAISSAQDGDIIQLQSDAALTAKNNVEKKITIDFNGYIISRAANTSGGIWWKVDMTFIDSDDTGRGGMKCGYGKVDGTEAKANLCGGRYDETAETILTGTNASFYNIPTSYEIVNINADGSADADGFKSRVVRNYLNDTKTEASFEMPTSDVTVDYELVRDMSVQMPVTVQDAQQNSRFRVQKQGETFVPVDMNMEQIVALFTVHDDIEGKDLTANTDYTVQLFAVDEEGQKTGVAIPFNSFTFAPGNYVAVAVAAEGSNYSGETALSNVFTLFQGYEIKVAAGEYATYYKDEALKVEDEEVELLTITAVEDGKAVLSNASDAMPKNTPFLVHNNGTEEKTILLSPCNEPDLAVTVANEFIGTLTEKTFTDQEMGAANYYVCNGKEFIQVRGAGTLAANRAYLKVDGTKTAPASIPFRRSIDGGEGTTGIDNVNVNLNDNEATWYDLGGRKLNGKPAQKGVYIKNGKKVVIK